MNSHRYHSHSGGDLACRRMGLPTAFTARAALIAPDPLTKDETESAM